MNKIQRAFRSCAEGNRAADGRELPDLTDSESGELRGNAHMKIVLRTMMRKQAINLLRKLVT